jgi:hypothetical protein
MYFQLAPQTLRTEGIESGLLPTPTASDGTTGAIIGKNDNFHMTKNGFPRKVNQNGVDGSVGLGRFAVMGLLPTPTASDMKNATLPPSQANRKDGIVKRILSEHGEIGKTSQLNPRFVLEMMGFPPDWTELPFQNGETNQSRRPETP